MGSSEVLKLCTSISQAKTVKGVSL